MLVSVNLGFHSLLLAIGFVVFAIFRHKWRNALAKKEEIMRLVAMASEEAAFAEVEATVEYNFVPVVQPYQCVVCCSSTTMRCSKCKSVRYCSGKCQIIHWRQGHKDECYHSISAMKFDIGADFDDQQMFQSKSDIDVETVKLDAECKEMDSDCSSTLSTSDFTPSGVGSGSFDISSEETFDQPRKSISGDCVPERTSVVGVAKIISPQSKSSSLGNHVGRVSCSHKLTKKKPSYPEEMLDVQLKSNQGKTTISENLQEANVNYKKREAASCKSLDRDIFTSRRSPSTGVSCSRIASGPDMGEEGSKSIDPKEVRTSSFRVSGDHKPSTSGGHLAPDFKPTVGFHSLPTKSGSKTNIQQNVSNGLKTSVRKVVEQLKVSSKSAIHGYENSLSGKYNYKLIFPYEQFVELYCYDKVELYPFGLINCGNSCYANAVLICLAFTRPLTSYLLRGMHSKACRKKEWCFICEFEYLIIKAREGASPLSPVRILSKIHKIGSHLGYGRQEDAHEFLRYAIDTMQSVCLKEAGVLGPSAEETTLVGQTFGGYLLSKIKCLKCLGKSERCERMMDLTVEIDGDIGTLDEALAQFTASEVLERDNKYRCYRCKSYEKARKKLTVLAAPNILTIVLKRFRSGNFEKLNKWVKFPEVLDMAPYMNRSSQSSALYSLYGVVVHLDTLNAAFSGHYVCYIRKALREWYRIDDSAVEAATLERVLSEGAYMLLYARCSPQAPALISSNLPSFDGKLKRRNLEAVPSSTTKSKSKSNNSGPKPDASMTHRKPHKFDGLNINQSLELDNWRYNSLQRFDTLSESSSIFSSSDGSSCSSASTKDSIATEDLSDYIFGDSAANWFSHYGMQPESSGKPSLPHQNYEGKLKPEGERSSSVLFSNQNRHRRRLTTHFESSGRGSEAEFDHFVYGNSCVSRSGASFRTIGNGSAQTFFERRFKESILAALLLLVLIGRIYLTLLRAYLCFDARKK